VPTGSKPVTVAECKKRAQLPQQKSVTQPLETFRNRPGQAGLWRCAVKTVRSDLRVTTCRHFYSWTRCKVPTTRAKRDRHSGYCQKQSMHVQHTLCCPTSAQLDNHNYR